MITDDVKITVQAGNGGRGLVTFSNTKGEKGPTGGNGGNGGNVFLEGVADLGALRQFRFKKDYEAENGEIGKSGLHDGANAEDLTLFVPVGTVCHNVTPRGVKGHTGSPKKIEITKIGQRELIANGGRGGKGNWYFRSSINTTPKQFQQGKPGEYFEIRLELKMIADVGFIGLPNVGKSSFLNELTNANSKVANYPFTTLEPNLGVYYDLILADIPGLIEGASAGKGLGIKFLRHIERTRVLFHFVAADSLDPIKDYESVKTELEAYDKSLTEKPEYVFLSKSDTVDEKTIEKIRKKFTKIGKDIIPTSIIKPESIESVKNVLNSLAAEKRA